MNDGIEAFRLQLQKELGLSIGPKDPLLALWVSQKELLEQNAAQQQKLLSEFQAALGRNQTAWSKRWRPAGGSPGVSLAASAVAFIAAVCAIFVHVIH